MLRFLFVMLPFAFIVHGCTREQPSYAEQGILTGADVRLCACCGGVFLQVQDGRMFQIESLPGMKNEELYKLTFPQKIAFNWQPDRDCGGIVYIKVTAYKLY